ncbi:hypothetical protein CBS101457_002588 [Exobasidium rhododendri]|nr:hypothetical protein CBS101457_002588 [Exobasidium rhododendri]
MKTSIRPRHILAIIRSSRHYCFSTSATSTAPAGPPYNILFCGTDEFARKCLIALHEAKDVCKSVSVLTPQDAKNVHDRRKRMLISPVKLWAEENGVHYDTVPNEGIKTYTPPSDYLKSATGQVAPQNVLVTVSFGELIPASLMANFHKDQRLNLHPSMLPLLAGAAPIQRAIARRLEKTGVTVQSLGETFDSGNIYAQEQTAIPPASTYESLEVLLARQGSQLLLKTLRNLPELARNAWPQAQGANASRAHKLRRSESRVQWEDWTAEDIDARHRGYGYLHPISTTLVEGKGIIFREIEVIKDISALPSPLAGAFLRSTTPGTGVYHPSTKSIMILCKQSQHFLSVKRLQTEGKKEMSADEWIVGYRDRSDENGLFHFA